MKRFEEMERKEKEQIIKQYYSWIFDVPIEEIELERELDEVLTRTYIDPYIYYPKILGDIYRTEIMSRLQRISQLGITILTDGVSKQNRLEHSKGTAYLKLEENIYLWQQSEIYRKVVTENNLKLYVFSEEIKAAVHDVGHPPLSHEIEYMVSDLSNLIEIPEESSYTKNSSFIKVPETEEKSKRLKVTHEQIGKMFLINDEQINEILMRIPNLNQAFFEVLEKDIFNNKSHMEGAFDVDRKDYSLRDSFFFGRPKDYIYPMYRRLFISKENKPIKKNDEKFKIEELQIIDVYEDSDFENILNFLIDRKLNYMHRYRSEIGQVHNIILNRFFRNVYASSDSITNELKKYLTIFLKLIKYNGLVKEDYEYFKNFDEINLYLEIIKIAENAKDNNLRNLATMLIPEIRAFMELIKAEIGLKDDRYKTIDNEIKKKVFNLIKNDTELSRKIKNRHYITENLILIKEKEDIPEEYKDIFSYSESSVTGYNKKEPIFFIKEDGTITSFEKHERLPKDLNMGKERTGIYYCIIPDLKEKGWTEEEIKTLKEKTQNVKFKKEKITPIVSLASDKVPETYLRWNRHDGSYSLRKKDTLEEFYEII